MASFVQQFNVYEQQQLAVTTGSGAGAFTTSQGKNGTDCLVINYGAVGCQLIFGASGLTAANTAGAAGLRQYYIPAGAIIIIKRGSKGLGIRYSGPKLRGSPT